MITVLFLGIIEWRKGSQQTQIANNMVDSFQTKVQTVGKFWKFMMTLQRGCYLGHMLLLSGKNLHVILGSTPTPTSPCTSVVGLYETISSAGVIWTRWQLHNPSAALSDGKKRSSLCLNEPQRATGSHIISLTPPKKIIWRMTSPQHDRMVPGPWLRSHRNLPTSYPQKAHHAGPINRAGYAQACTLYAF